MNKIISVLCVVTLCNAIDGFAFRPKNIQNIHPYIVNGTDTTIQDHPYQVSLRYFGSHWCGGTILSENLILTAAHCLEPYTPEQIVLYYTIRVGATNVNEGNIYNLENAIYHADFTTETYDWDVALLKLVNNLEYSETVAPVVLAESGRALPYGTDSVVTGWGRLYDNGPLPTVLQKAFIEVLDRNRCIETYRDINPITANMFCAGSFYGLVDSCGGDSGGPVVHDGVQIGIVSWGMECARFGFPGVYADVSVLRSWIDESTQILLTQNK